MVRAILSGTKTQTRRIVKLRGADCVEERWDCHPHPMWPFSPQHDEWIGSPYGKADDRLWVRETHAFLLDPGASETWNLYAPHTRPSPTDTYLGHIPTPIYRADGEPAFVRTWRPAIHMPRWASRITLEITDVRVERLQAITEEDAEREGCSMHTLRGAKAAIVEPDGTSSEMTFAWTSAAYAFATLWAQINGNEGPKSWQANPWVWVITFKPVSP
jgi:hypothetical protein